jgi:AraC-like DNA-binding protein
MIGLADSYSFLATTGFMPFQEAWAKSAELTYQGLALNDQLADGHYQLANLYFFTACDYAGAFKATLKAIECNPNYVEAQQYLSFLYMLVGKKREARQHLKIALTVDPLSPETLFFSAYFDYMNEDYAGALEKLNHCLAQKPGNIPAHTVKCYCLLKLGRYEAVLDYLDLLPAESVAPGDRLGLTTVAHTLKNDGDQAAKYLEDLAGHAATAEGFRASAYLLFAYAASGEKEKAFQWISEAIQSKSPLLLIYFVDPLVESLKADPRYAQFQEIIFPETSTRQVSKNRKALLDNQAIARYTLQLKNHIQEKKPYLDPGLSLRALADQLGMHPNQLSWLLNESIGKNFSEFVNHYRVDAFKHLAKDPKNAHLTLSGLAFESGFNSKTVFNTYFKKETGLTPKQYLKEQQ